MTTRKGFLAETGALLVLVTGCGRFWDDPYVTVTTTPLNWVEIHYYNANRQPVRRTSVRISGSGLVDVKSGTSKLVSDSFAKDFKQTSWGDMRTVQFTVDPEHVREIFQDLVDAGLFDKDKVHETLQPSPGRFVAVRAAIDNKTFSEPENIFETDPELAERLHNVVMEFNRATLGKKRASVK